jgi:hypothetical protein
MYNAPPPAPPAELYVDPPPDPHVTGASADPYSHVPATLLFAPPPAWLPPPPRLSVARHGPAAEPHPPPFADSVPATASVPFVESDTLPTALMVEPASIRKADVAAAKPPVIDHVEPVSESVLLAKIADDVESAKELPPEKRPSDTKTLKLLASVSVPPER